VGFDEFVTSHWELKENQVVGTQHITKSRSKEEK